MHWTIKMIWAIAFVGLALLAATGTAYESHSILQQRKDAVCPNATDYEMGAGATICLHIISCAYRNPLVTITGDGRESYVACFHALHQQVHVNHIDHVMADARLVWEKQRELEDSRMRSSNHFNFRQILKQREDVAVSEFLSSIMTTRTEMDKNALYIQQKASAREVPVQIIVQRVDDFLWAVENHAGQLMILASTFDAYKVNLRNEHVSIIYEANLQANMTKELLQLKADLLEAQHGAARSAWINYIKIV